MTSAFNDDDDDDNAHTHNSFVDQINNLLCFLNEQDILVKLKLCQSYFSSFTAVICGLWIQASLTNFALLGKRPLSSS
jgi:hypothetical protein